MAKRIPIHFSKSFLVGIVGLLLLVNPLYSFTQIDSLKSELVELNKQKQSVERDYKLSQLLNTLSEKMWKENNFNQAIHYATISLYVSKTLPEEQRNQLNALSYKYLGICYWYQNANDKAIEYYKKAVKEYDAVGDLDGLASVYNNLGLAYDDKSDYSGAINYHSKSLKIREEANDRAGLASCYNNLGNVYYAMGNYTKATENYYRALKIDEEFDDKSGIASDLNNIGIILIDNGEYDRALKVYFKTLTILEELNDINRIAKAYINIGLIYNELKDYDNATNYFLKALKIKEELKDVNGIALAYNNLGVVCGVKKDFIKALDYYMNALAYMEKGGDLQGVSMANNNIGLLFINLKNYQESENYLRKGLKIAEEIESKDMIMESYAALSLLDSAKGDWHNAYVNLRLHIDAKDSLFNESKSQQMAELQVKYENEKKEQQIELLNKDKELQQAVVTKQKNAIYSGVCVLALVLLFLWFVFTRLNITKKQKALIEEQKAEVELQKLKVEEAHIQLEEKNKEVMSSIRYAKRIQQALLKEEEQQSEHLPEHFVVFKPKDIVSGDFYWTLEKENHLYLAVADCTGHGVPGAFLTMLGTSFLNEINAVDKLLSPAEILDDLRSRFIKELSQTGADGESKDGMDISLLCLNLKTNELQWSGANNPLFVISNGELIITKADKQPIGFSHKMTPFTNHSIQFKKSDCVYLFSDGYADQFGGEKGKKYKQSSFKEKLLEIYTKSMSQQKQILEDTFDKWKGEYEQVDDVCVVGMRL